MRTIQISIILSLAFFTSSAAAEELPTSEERQYTARRMITPKDDFTIIAGPGSPQLFGMLIPGGLSYMSNAICHEDCGGEGAAFGGIVFGLFQDFNLGLALKQTALFTWATYAKQFGNVELGTRMVAKKLLVPDNSSGALVGVFASFRKESFRFDTGVFVPIRSTEERRDEFNFDFHIPARLAVNLSPYVFAGVETGIVGRQFREENELFIPQGFFGGFSGFGDLWLIDFALSVTREWAQGLYFISPPEDEHHQLEYVRYMAGITVHLNHDPRSEREAEED